MKTKPAPVSASPQTKEGKDFGLETPTALGEQEASRRAVPIKKDCLTLKWGTLKGWKLNTEKAQELMRQYIELGASVSVMSQRDTPEQKELIYQIIDAFNADTIYLDWDGKDVSKEEAKKYIADYGKQ